LPGRHRSSPQRLRAAGRHRRGPSRLTVGAVAVTVVTVAGVSAGVAFAATGTPPSGGPGGQAGQGSQGAGHGRPAAGTLSPAAVSGQATPYQAGSQQSRSSGHSGGKTAVRHPAKSGRRTTTAARSGGGARPRPAHPHATPSPSASATASPAKPYEFYDSIDPETVPAGAEVATYADGAHPTPVSLVAGRKHVLWIDDLGTDPKAQAVDVEPGCATPSQVPQWVKSHLADDPGSLAIVYTTISEWSEVQQDVSGLPASMQSKIRWWIADPTGSPHIVPGSQATQWYWGSNYDESEALPSF
jgi:hypothetical protein